MTNQITPRSTTTGSESKAPPMIGTTPGRRRGGVAAAFVATAVLLTGCTGGPGDRDDFVDVLTRDDNFAANEAECIADAVFDRYGEDGDALQKISAAESYEWLTGAEGVEGFDEFFESTVTDCTAIGPSAGE